jgi:hypothetical protein
VPTLSIPEMFVVVGSTLYRFVICGLIVYWVIYTVRESLPLSREERVRLGIGPRASRVDRWTDLTVLIFDFTQCAIM